MKNVSSMPRLSTSFVIISATGNLLLFRRNDIPYKGLNMNITNLYSSIHASIMYLK